MDTALHVYVKETKGPPKYKGWFIGVVDPDEYGTDLVVAGKGGEVIHVASSRALVTTTPPTK